MRTEEELRAALGRAVELIEREPIPPVEAVVRRGRKRFAIRMASGALGAALLAGGILGSIVMLGRGFHPASVPADGSDGSTESVLNDGPTYILSDFRIMYPYQPVDGRGQPIESASDPSRAGVSYTVTWSESAYPATAWCRVALSDGSGAVVGSERFLLSSPEPTWEQPWFTAVAVSAEPLLADGSCEPGQGYPAGAGYTFEDVRVIPSDSGGVGWSTIVATARWATPHHPDWRACEVRVILRDGRTETFDAGTLSAPDGQEVEFEVSVPPDQIEQASITCSELEAPER